MKYSGPESNGKFTEATTFPWCGQPRHTVQLAHMIVKLGWEVYCPGAGSHVCTPGVQVSLSPSRGQTHEKSNSCNESYSIMSAKH